MPLPVRKDADLRLGRVSLPGANYFVTACTAARAPVLTEPATASRLLRTLADLHSGGDVAFHAATIMPDHVHMLFALGGRLGLAQVVAKFKALARDHGHANWHWQENMFEHQLRTRESIEDYGFYVFMNPYRAGLCALDVCWPWWFCPDPSSFRFLSGLGPGGTPQDSWLTETERIESRITGAK